MKHKNTAGFSILWALIILLIISTIGLAIYGISEDRSAKKTFSEPQKVTASTSPSTPSAASTSTLSSADQAFTVSNTLKIDTYLEAYYATNGYYPGTIAPNEFAALTTSGGNAASIIQEASTTPAGVAYNYVPTPVGCTTTNKTCQHFSLTAEDSGGNTISQKRDQNSKP